MRSPGKKSLHRLEIDDTFDHQFFGIVSAEADYKISLEINKILKIKLSNAEPVSTNENDNALFSRFTAPSGINDLSYQLVCNKSGISVLSRNFPALDYLFIICGSLNDEIVRDTQVLLRGLKEITAVFLLEKEKLSDEYIVLQTL